jgi:hypothetical protein
MFYSLTNAQFLSCLFENRVTSSSHASDCTGRHLDDESVVNREMTALFKSGTLDVTFLRRVKTIYLLHCNPRVATRLSQYLVQFSKSRNSVIRWHCERILGELLPITGAAYS